MHAKPIARGMIWLLTKTMIPRAIGMAIAGLLPDLGLLSDQPIQREMWDANGNKVVVEESPKNLVGEAITLLLIGAGSLLIENRKATEVKKTQELVDNLTPSTSKSSRMACPVPRRAKQSRSRPRTSRPNPQKQSWMTTTKRKIPKLYEKTHPCLSYLSVPARLRWPPGPRRKPAGAPVPIARSDARIARMRARNPNQLRARPPKLNNDCPSSSSRFGGPADSLPDLAGCLCRRRLFGLAFLVWGCSPSSDPGRRSSGFWSA